MPTPVASIEVPLTDPSRPSRPRIIVALWALALYIVAQIALRASELLLPQSALWTGTLSLLLFVVLLAVFALRREYNSLAASAVPAIGESVGHSATDLVEYALTGRGADAPTGALLHIVRELPLRLGALGLALWVLVTLMRRLTLRTETPRA